MATMPSSVCVWVNSMGLGTVVSCSISRGGRTKMIWAVFLTWWTFLGSHATLANPSSHVLTLTKQTFDEAFEVFPFLCLCLFSIHPDP
jgi:hypothetical protein